MARINAVQSDVKIGMKLFTDSLHKEDFCGTMYEKDGFAIFLDDISDCLQVTSIDMLNNDSYDGALPCFVFDGSVLGSFPYELSNVIYEVLCEHYIPFNYVSGINSTRLDLNWGGVDVTFWATPRLSGGVSLSVKEGKKVIAEKEKVNPFLALMGGVQ